MAVTQNESAPLVIDEEVAELAEPHAAPSGGSRRWAKAVVLILAASAICGFAWAVHSKGAFQNIEAKKGGIVQMMMEAPPQPQDLSRARAWEYCTENAECQFYCDRDNRCAPDYCEEPGSDSIEGTCDHRTNCNSNSDCYTYCDRGGKCSDGPCEDSSDSIEGTCDRRENCNANSQCFWYCDVQGLCSNGPCEDPNDSIQNFCPALPTFFCFPGDASVTLERGAVHMSEVRAGDRVLVQRTDGLAFEPVLGLLHALRGGDVREYTVVQHRQGVFRASANHLVFLASGKDTAVAHLRVGDELLVTVGNTTEASEVLAVNRASSTTGMYAPLTPAGTLVVDGVVSSNYAEAQPSAPIPHAALHAVFFPLRALHALGLDAAGMMHTAGEISTNAYVNVLYDRLQLHIFHESFLVPLKA